MALLREQGIEIRPSFLPFTPWTTMADVVELLEFVATHDLIDNVDPVQYTIRLLLPEGSLLLDRSDLVPYLGHYDPELLGYPWTAADPAVDALQVRVARVVEHSLDAGESIETTFGRVWRESGAPGSAPTAATAGRPRLSEPWFCCAEPTEAQLTTRS